MRRQAKNDNTLFSSIFNTGRLVVGAMPVKKEKERTLTHCIFKEVVFEPVMKEFLVAPPLVAHPVVCSRSFPLGPLMIEVLPPQILSLVE